MPRSIDNVGSAARDFCMLERNLLALLKLGEFPQHSTTAPNHFSDFIQPSCFRYCLQVFYFELVSLNLPIKTTQRIINPKQVYPWPRSRWWHHSLLSALPIGSIRPIWGLCGTWGLSSLPQSKYIVIFSKSVSDCPSSPYLAILSLVVRNIFKYQTEVYLLIAETQAGVVITTCIALLADEHELWRSTYGLPALLERSEQPGANAKLLDIGDPMLGMIGGLWVIKHAHLPIYISRHEDTGRLTLGGSLTHGLQRGRSCLITIPLTRHMLQFLHRKVSKELMVYVHCNPHSLVLILRSWRPVWMSYDCRLIGPYRTTLPRSHDHLLHINKVKDWPSRSWFRVRALPLIIISFSFRLWLSLLLSLIP